LLMASRIKRNQKFVNFAIRTDRVIVTRSKSRYCKSNFRANNNLQLGRWQ
jgi:hypothetical protein